MPLSPPAARQQLHTRTYAFRGYRRDDGLWELEGEIFDRKTYDFPSEDRGAIKAGEPVHGMAIRLTLDDSLTVRAVEAVTDWAPHSICPAITPNFTRMVGARIGPGWRKAVRERLGGTAGCTHLAELLIAMATPAYQTIIPVLARERREKSGARDMAESWPGLINSCHAYRSDGPLVRRWWPQHYDGPEES